jgi:hypothetical protein
VTTKESGLYVYAIGPQDRLRAVFTEGGLPAGVQNGIPLALITHDDLAAVVSEVSLAQFGEGRFEENLKDVTWAAERVMRHERVAEFLASRSALVPLRFGVMYSTPDKVRETLAGRAARLREILKDLDGREEWGLSIHVDRKKLQDGMVDLSPTLTDMQKRAAASAPGQRYLLEKKLETLRVTESKAETNRAVRDIRTALEPPSHAVKDLPIRPIEAKQEPAMVGKLSFLIDRRKLKNFRAIAERMAVKYAAHGFTMELTGPWPPYNFSE